MVDDEMLVAEFETVFLHVLRNHACLDLGVHLLQVAIVVGIGGGEFVDAVVERTGQVLNGGPGHGDVRLKTCSDVDAIFVWKWNHGLVVNDDSKASLVTETQ